MALLSGEVAASIKKSIFDKLWDKLTGWRKKKEDPKMIKRKPSTIVMKYMQDFGYKVIPVNPSAVGEVIHG